jgi:hypothetical protein
VRVNASSIGHCDAVGVTVSVKVRNAPSWPKCLAKSSFA